ncbi:MAG: DUF4359 domain-containing protein [Bacteroidaceae bacterium]|nr:DUF4359 domain-containing protein [Bacteroidaceae bacterium]
MKAFFYTLLILVIISATCVMTCPEKEAHTEALMEVLTDVMEEKMGDEMIENALNLTISSMAIELGKMIIKNNMKVDNYFLFSVGKAGDNVISVGVMNHVFTISKEELLQKIEEQK